jgi:uncharacterized protein DUF5666
MQTLATMLRSKVGLAVCGVILVGGLGGILGASSVARPSVQSNNGGITNTNTGTATDTTGSATQGPGGSASPTDTVTVPTNTTGGGVIGTGQTIDLHGAIGTIDTAANTFILKVGGTPVTVDVSGQTSFQGASTSFQGLRTGWVAEVKGRAQSDGTFQAFVVNSDTGA